MNRRVEPDLTDFEYMLAAIVDIIVDDVPIDAVWDLSMEAETAAQFFEGVQALVQLGDIVREHYEET